MKVGIGQDSHRFDSDENKKLILGGVIFDGCLGLKGNSDSDVVLHAITNAVSSVTCKNILGKPADDLCKQGITNSAVYLKEALKYLKEDIEHVAISIECKFPKITPKIDEMRDSISNILNISKENIGITATTGEELTEVGKGNGISVICIISVK